MVSLARFPWRRRRAVLLAEQFNASPVGRSVVIRLLQTIKRQLKTDDANGTVRGKHDARRMNVATSSRLNLRAASQRVYASPLRSYPKAVLFAMPQTDGAGGLLADIR